MQLTEDQINSAAIAVSNLGAKAEICGQWVWAEFREKPDRETLTAMKAAGFRWSRKKSKWYLPGSPTRSKKSMPWVYIVEKYGTIDAKDLVAA